MPPSPRRLVAGALLLLGPADALHTPTTAVRRTGAPQAADPSIPVAERQSLWHRILGLPRFASRSVPTVDGEPLIMPRDPPVASSTVKGYLPSKAVSDGCYLMPAVAVPQLLAVKQPQQQSEDEYDEREWWVCDSWNDVGGKDATHCSEAIFDGAVLIACSY